MMKQSFKLPEKGVYTLIISISKETEIEVGKLGKKRFLKGYYTYTGSALGKGSNLRKRVLRHLGKKKRKFWHIDFLLSSKESSINAVIAAPTNIKKECQINLLIRKKLKPNILVKGFGSSDCKSGCRAHLLYFGEENPRTEIVKLYKEMFGFKPSVVDFC